jgi:hypothetical protein
MGFFIEINDTLQINKEQGWPPELDLEKHLKNPYKIEDFRDKVFDFKNKPKIRIFKIPPLRNFLVENRDGKWVCWGRCVIVELRHDNINETTSGKFKIIRIFSPAEMKQIEQFTVTDKEQRWFDR